MNIKEMRALAREKLKGNWVKLFLPFLFVQILIIAIENLVIPISNSNASDLTKSISSIVIIMILTIIAVVTSYGLVIITAKFCRGEEISLKIFIKESFVNQKRAFKLFEKYLLKVGTWIFIAALLLPTTAISLRGLTGNATVVVITVAISIILMFLFLIYGIVQMLRFSLTYWLAYDFPDRKLDEIFVKSRKLMQRNKAKYLTIPLTFIGWGIVAFIPELIFSGIAINIWPQVMTAEGLTSTMPIWGEIIMNILLLPLLFVYIYYFTTIYEFYNAFNPKVCFNDDYEKPSTNAGKYYGILSIALAILIGFMGLATNVMVQESDVYDINSYENGEINTINK